MFTEISESVVETQSRRTEEIDERGVITAKELTEIEENISEGQQSGSQGDIPSEVLEDIEMQSVNKEDIEQVGEISEADFKKIEADEFQEITYPREVYNKAIEKEPNISRDVIEAAEGHCSHLEGYEYRIKSFESYERKVNSIVEETEVSPERAAESINDAIRYTEVADGEHLEREFHRTLNELESNGHSVREVKNTWLNPEVAYKGVNVVIQSPEGQAFEMQFHTPESLEARETIHPLYEEYRLPSTPRYRRRELSREMKSHTRELRPPKDVDRINR